MADAPASLQDVAASDAVCVLRGPVRFLTGPHLFESRERIGDCTGEQDESVAR